MSGPTIAHVIGEVPTVHASSPAASSSGRRRTWVQFLRTSLTDRGDRPAAAAAAAAGVPPSGVAAAADPLHGGSGAAPPSARARGPPPGVPSAGGATALGQVHNDGGGRPTIRRSYSDDDARSAPSVLHIKRIVEHIADFVPPNDVACNLRLVDKVTAALLRNPNKNHATVRLWQPVPRHAFARHWSDPRVVADLRWWQRRRLLQLTVRSGDLANTDVLLAHSALFHPSAELLVLAAAAGRLALCQALHRRGCPVTEPALRAAADSGHLAVCEWLLEEGCGGGPEVLLAAVKGGHRGVCEVLLARGCAWNDKAPAAAAARGDVGLMDWLLAAAATLPLPPPLQQQQQQQRSQPLYGGSGSGGGAVPVDVPALLAGAARGCDLPTLQRLYDTWPAAVGLMDVQLRQAVIRQAALSSMADSQAKLDWLKGAAGFGGPDADCSLAEVAYVHG